MFLERINQLMAPTLKRAVAELTYVSQSSPSQLLTLPRQSYLRRYHCRLAETHRRIMILHRMYSESTAGWDRRTRAITLIPGRVYPRCAQRQPSHSACHLRRHHRLSDWTR